MPALAKALPGQGLGGVAGQQHAVDGIGQQHGEIAGGLGEGGADDLALVFALGADTGRFQAGAGHFQQAHATVGVATHGLGLVARGVAAAHQQGSHGGAAALVGFVFNRGQMASDGGGGAAQVGQQAGTGSIGGHCVIVFALLQQGLHTGAVGKGRKGGTDGGAAIFVSGQNFGGAGSSGGGGMVTTACGSGLCGVGHGFLFRGGGCSGCCGGAFCLLLGGSGQRAVAALRQRLTRGGSNGGGIGDAVDQAQRQRLGGGVVVVFAVGQQGQHVFGFAGLLRVAGGHGLGPGVQLVGLVAQLGGIACGICPGRVNHVDGVFSHAHGVTAQGDQAGNAHGHAVNLGGDVGAVAAHGVVDGQAIGHAAAQAVDAHGDGIHVQRLQLGDKAAGAGGFFPPAFANVAINQNFCGGLHTSRCGGLRGFAADGVPAGGLVGFIAHKKMPLKSPAVRAMRGSVWIYRPKNTGRF